MKSGCALINLGKIAAFASQLAVHVVNDSTNGDTADRRERRARLWRQLKTEVAELDKRIATDGSVTGAAN